jgi:hypothetical protein
MLRIMRRFPSPAHANAHVIPPYCACRTAHLQYVRPPYLELRIYQCAAFVNGILEQRVGLTGAARILLS